MKSPMITGCLVALVATLVFTTASTVTEQAQKDSVNRPQTNDRAQRKRELRARYPVTDFDAPVADNTSQRAQRGKKFEKQGFAINDSSPHGVEEVLENDWGLHTPALPVNQSELIVIGEVLQSRAHLSPGQTGIYSEFDVRIDSVLKNERNSLSAGEIIPVARVGGHVRYANGHTRLYRISGQNMPRLSARYLFFLKGFGESDIYQVLTGYELVGQKVLALDDPAPMKAYDQMNEDTFIETIRKQIMQ